MIDHIIYAAPDLNDAIQTFAQTYGVEATPGGPHLGFGTRNALIGLDRGAYLELMAIDPAQAVPPERRFFGLDRDSPPRYLAWCARSSRTLEETAAIAREAGFDLGEIFGMSRRHPSGELMSWQLTSPFADRSTVLPFYIDRGEVPSPALSLPPSLTLDSLTLVHPEAGRVRAILDALGENGVRVVPGPAPAFEVRLRRHS